MTPEQEKLYELIKKIGTIADKLVELEVQANALHTEFCKFAETFPR